MNGDARREESSVLSRGYGYDLVGGSCSHHFFSFFSFSFFSSLFCFLFLFFSKFILYYCSFAVVIVDVLVKV